MTAKIQPNLAGTGGALTFGLLILIAACYGLLCYWTPLAYDDWVFMAEWKGVNGDTPLSISGLWNFWRQIREYDNGRLANTLSPLSTMFSPWKDLFPWITGILAAFIVAAATIFSFGRKSLLSPFCIAMVWMAVFFLLPWRNALFVADYSLNYIWASAVTLAFMSMVVVCERRGWNIYSFILVLILAFLAGGWHEGFAVATLAGFFLYTLVRLFTCQPGTRGFSIQWYLIGCFYAAVTCAFFFCPGMLLRTGAQLGVVDKSLNWIKLLFDVLPVIFLFFVVILFLIVPSLRSLLRDAWKNKWFVIGAGIVAVGTLLSLLFRHQPRSAFWPDLMAIVMLFILTRPVWTRIGRRSSIRVYVTILGIASCLVPLFFIFSWQSELFKESEAILQEMEESESGTVYHDIIKGTDLPPITLKMTNHPAWVTDFHFHGLKEFTGKPYPAVVPTILGDESAYANGVLLAGNAHALLINNAIVLPYETPKPATIGMELQLKDGTEAEAFGLQLPFRTPMGAVYTYILPYGDVPYGEITGLSL